MTSEKIVENIYKEIKEKITSYNGKYKLSVILIGNNPSSEIYVNIKRKKAVELGIEFDLHKYNDDEINQEQLLQLIDDLNNDTSVNGILTQFPLNKKFDEFLVSSRISPSKDVDQVNPYNVGINLWGKGNKASCTAAGIIKLLEFYNIDLVGKNVLVIGDSMIVGKPLSSLLINKNATVTIANKYTKDLKNYTKNADVLISATGVKHLIKADDIKEGSVLVDVGVTKENGKIYGDIDYKSTIGKATYVTPPTNSVGPLTVAFLMLNIIK